MLLKKGVFTHTNLWHVPAKSLQVMSDSVRPYGLQPTRLLCPWDSPGKNTGLGCHFLLQCMKVESESEVSQSRLTRSDPMDCSLPGPPSMGFSRQELLEWLAIDTAYFFSSIFGIYGMCTFGLCTLTCTCGRVVSPSLLVKFCIDNFNA